MATIRYDIEIGPDGAPTVVQDVILIDSHDQVVFWTTGQNVPAGKVITIEFEDSPFKEGPPRENGPQSKQPFAVTQLDTTRYNVSKSNAEVPPQYVSGFGVRRTSPFQCGLSDQDSKTEQTKEVKAETFEPWSAMPNNGVQVTSHAAAATAHTAAAAALTSMGAGNPPSGSAAAWTAAAAAHTSAAAAHTAAAAASASTGAAGSFPTGGSDGN